MRGGKAFWAVVAFALSSTLFFVAGCGDPVGPAGSSRGDVRLAVAAPPAPPAPPDAALQHALAVEQQRLKLAAAASKATFDSAVAEWKLLNASSGKHGPNTAPDTLLRCAPQPYSSAVKIIGPAGGVLTMGRNTLFIPRGAVAVPTVISGETPPTTLVQVKFSPHGLVFNTSSLLTINYTHCIVPANQTQQVVYVGTGHQVLEHERSRDDRLSQSVQALIDHFSSYAVAY